MPEFDCSREVVLPAAPERVWQAVATTDGNAGYCFFGRNAFGGPVGVSIHAFDGRDADKEKQAWQEWLAGALA